MADGGTFWREHTLGLAEEEEIPRPCCPTPPHAAHNLGPAQSELPANRAAVQSAEQAAHHVMPLHASSALHVSSHANQVQAQNEEQTATMSTHPHSPSVTGAGPGSHVSSQADCNKESSVGWSEMADNAPASQGQDQSTSAMPEACAEMGHENSTSSSEGTSDRGTEDRASQVSSAGDGRGGKASIMLRGIEELDSLSGDESSRSDSAGASMHLCLP